MADHDPAGIERLQAQYALTVDQQNREDAVRLALSILDPDTDAAEADYPDVLRRLRVAVDRELATWTSPPMQLPSVSQA
jgi:hypothetical protein